MGTRWALAAAGLAVLPPALWYGGLLMTEALFYPLVAAALLGLARMLEVPTLVRQGTFLLILSFAAAVRLQALLLLPVLLVATGLFAWFGRSLEILRRLVPLLALVGLSAVALGVLYATGENDLFGAYGAVADEAPSSTGTLAQIAWHTAALYLMVLGLPLLATATLAVDAARKGEDDLPVRAFLAVATAYVVLLILQVSTFAAGHLDHVSRRYLITALPPLLLGLCLWISRGSPRPAGRRRARGRELARRARHAAGGPLRHCHLRRRCDRCSCRSESWPNAEIPRFASACSRSGSFSGRSSSRFLAGSWLGRPEESRSGSSCSPRWARGRWIGCRRSSERARSPASSTGSTALARRMSSSSTPASTRRRRSHARSSGTSRFAAPCGSKACPPRRCRNPWSLSDETARSWTSKAWECPEPQRRRADDARSTRRAGWSRPRLPSSHPATPSGGSTSLSSSSRAERGSPL